MATNPSRILIVDDEETLAFFLKKSLLRETAGTIIDVAVSGEEALSRILEQPYDLVVADLRLPGMNGLELIARVRERLPHARTILMTAYGNDVVEAEANRLQVFRYITKPFRLPEMTAAVKEALEKLAVSSREVLVLSDSRFEAVTRVLEQLRQDIGAQCILMADSLGQMITSVGLYENIDMPLVTSLVAAGFATSFELMRYLGQQDARNLNYFEGREYDIYTSNIGENLFLTLIFSKRASLSRIGTVWLYTKRAVAQLQELLPASNLSEEENISLSDDFTHSLDQMLDEGFLGSGTEPPSPAAGRPTAWPEKTARPANAPSRLSSSSPTPTAPAANAQPPNYEERDNSCINLEEAWRQGLLSDDLYHQLSGRCE